MVHSFGVLALVSMLLNAGDFPHRENAKPIFEIRIFTAVDGKLAALETRIRDHGCACLAKHGMTLVGCFAPVDTKKNQLYVVIQYQSLEARESSRKAMQADPDWKTILADSEKDGPLVADISSWVLETTDFSPSIADLPAKKGDRIFELRVYTATPGNLANLNARFRDHTIALFAKHGMTNVVYWNLAKGQPNADNMLIYMLAHDDVSAHQRSFATFRDDPAWKTALAESERKAGGRLTEAKNGVLSTLLRPLPCSPMK